MKICYECEKDVAEISPRSRCVACEYRRSIFNELENDSLREQLATAEAKAGNAVQDKNSTNQLYDDAEKRNAFLRSKL